MPPRKVHGATGALGLPTSKSFPQLPDELLVLIARYLDPPDRIRAAQVDRHWRASLHGAPSLWTAMQLNVHFSYCWHHEEEKNYDEQVDADRCDIEQLERLTRYHRLWAFHQTRMSNTVSLQPGALCAPFSLSILYILCHGTRSSEFCRVWSLLAVFPVLHLHGLRFLHLKHVDEDLQDQVCAVLAPSCRHTLEGLTLVMRADSTDIAAAVVVWLEGFPKLATFTCTTSKSLLSRIDAQVNDCRRAQESGHQGSLPLSLSEKQSQPMSSLHWDFAGYILGTSVPVSVPDIAPDPDEDEEVEIDEEERKEPWLYRCSPSRLQNLRYLHLNGSRTSNVYDEPRFCTESPLQHLQYLYLKNMIFLCGAVPASIRFSKWPLSNIKASGLTENVFEMRSLKTLKIHCQLYKTNVRASGHEWTWSQPPISPMNLLSRLEAPQLEHLELVDGLESYVQSTFPLEIDSWPRFCQKHAHLSSLVISGTSTLDTASWLALLPNLRQLVLKEVEIDFATLASPTLANLEYLGLPFTILEPSLGVEFATAEMKEMVERCKSKLKLLDLRGVHYLKNDDLLWLEESRVPYVWNFRAAPQQGDLFPSAYFKTFPDDVRRHMHR